MDFENSLNNQLLIAMPGMHDPNFHSTVTLICEHNDEGALGIVINRPLRLSLGGLFEQMSLDKPDMAAAKAPILSGGPVARERGFVLHNPGLTFKNSMSVSENIRLTLSRDILNALAAGKGPEKSLIALGYAGWEPGQLETEMLANTWLNIPASPEIVFDIPFSDRWVYATNSLGIDISRLSSHAGHA
jgi:putative transcriptional regulator